MGILVNNAGHIYPQGLDEVDEGRWDDILRINLKSIFLVISAVLPGMLLVIEGASST